MLKTLILCIFIMVEDLNITFLSSIDISPQYKKYSQKA